MSDTHHSEDHCWIAKSELDRLIAYLRQEGHHVLGPRVEEAAIVYAEVDSMTDLPQGYRDEQQAGKYRVHKTAHNNYFEFNVGPHSWKQFLFPPKVTVATARRQSDGWAFTAGEQDESPQKLAFLGVRACELAAIAVQDRVFLEGPYVDPIYQRRRESLFIVAVNCTVAASTCFCTSMGTGPKCRNNPNAKHAFDLALTELDDGFVVEIGSEKGSLAVQRLDTQRPTRAMMLEAAEMEQRAVRQIEKRLDTTDIRDLLLGNLDHPRWDQVAQRCLSCTNCTMVCPTCFCSTVTEVSDLSGDNVERQRQWDSCFNIDFGYTASGIVRNETRSRFRQWLTHKLASWHDQFDTSGCVGCGRCITWCPVGIDLTEEVAAIRQAPAPHRTLPIVELEKNAVCAVRENAE